MRIFSEAKALAGVLLRDRRRYREAIDGDGRLDNGDPAWVGLRNRNEHLVINPDGPGVRCDWRWSSHLHACGVMPDWGRRLMQRTLADWPICFHDRPLVEGPPTVSFLITHRGDDRLAQLRLVIRSIFGQQDVAVECVVIDLSDTPAGNRLPDRISYQHIDTSQLQPGWYKAWAFNIAARRASGSILVFHDGDICVPNRYAGALQRHLIQGSYQAASIQRFLFYLSESTTAATCGNAKLAVGAPETVLQNWTGGTIAIERGAFFRIGGFDEGFVDWGGEDGEFYDRCLSLNMMNFGYLPFCHLWHVPQAGRRQAGNPNTEQVLPSRLSIPRQDRIQELSRRDFGNPSGPDPPSRYAITMLDSSPLSGASGSL